MLRWSWGGGGVQWDNQVTCTACSTDATLIMGWGGAITCAPYGCYAVATCACYGCYAVTTCACCSSPSKKITAARPLIWKNVSNIAGTQVLDGSWQGFKTFLPTHICTSSAKRKATARCTSMFLAYTCGLADKVFSIPRQRSWKTWRLAVMKNFDGKWRWANVVASISKTFKINSSLR